MLGVLALLVGCQNEELYQEEESLYSFDVSLESIISEPETKTYADEQHLVVWHNDDRVSVFEKKEYWEEYKYTGRTGTTGGRLDKITSEGSGTGGDLDYYYAVYPHSELNGFNSQGHLLLTLPHEQPYDEFSFGRGTNLMVSSSEDNTFKFKNIGGYLVFKLYGEGVSVSSIRLTGNNKEEITGDVDVVISPGVDPVTKMSTARYAVKYDDAVLVCDPPVTLGTTASEYKEFWFVLPPMTFEGGFSIEVTTADGDVWTKTTEKPWTITRNHYTPVSAMEVVLEHETTVPIPEAVDMGLSVKWASFNLGASAPEEFGDYYAWGEVVPKDRYHWVTYKWCEGTGNSLTKYNSESDYGIVDNKYILDSEDDAANYVLRGDWRIPSTKEWDELINPNNCDWTWTTQNDVNGYLVTSKRTDNSIFIPVAGLKSNDTFYPCNNSFTYYWLNELINPNDSKWSKNAWSHYSDRASAGNFRQDRIDSYCNDRYSGLPIRPILDTDENTIICDDHIDLWAGYTRSISVTLQNGSVDGLSFFSKDENVVTVDNNGIVQAVGVGTATIRVSTPDGTNSAYCSVTVYPAPEIIDLGLSVKWASFNIGATSPEDSGFLLAWGETLPKSTYSWATYKWCNGSKTTLTKYNTTSAKGTVDNKVTLDDDDDVARLWSNGQWRMPTKAEVDELYRNCERSSSDGIRSATFTSTINGNSIFFPVANYNYAIWTSELEEGVDYPDFALCLAPGGWQSNERSGGLTVRAVLVEK